MTEVQQDAFERAQALLDTVRHKVPDGVADDLAQLDDILGEMMAENAAFTSHMAHELRLPMTSIRGYIDMMAKGHTGPLNDMQTQFAEVIQNNVLRMQRLVQDVSDYSKIRGGILPVETRMEMYKNLIMGVEKDTKALAEEREHALSFETPQGMPLLNIDPIHARRALVSLVENALLYTPAGTGEITVTGAKQGDDAQITIADNGIGINAEDYTKLFVPFERGDEDLVREYKGHGLGIPIAASLIALMDGTLTIESQPEQGTTVTVTLPGMKMG